MAQISQLRRENGTVSNLCFNVAESTNQTKQKVMLKMVLSTLQLLIRDAQLFDLIEELTNYVEGILGQVDSVSLKNGGISCLKTCET